MSRDELRAGHLLGYLLRSLPYQYAHRARGRIGVGAVPVDFVSAPGRNQRTRARSRGRGVNATARATANGSPSPGVLGRGAGGGHGRGRLSRQADRAPARVARRRGPGGALGRARPARPGRLPRRPSTAPRSSSTSPPASAASAFTAATRRRSAYDNLIMGVERVRGLARGWGSRSSSRPARPAPTRRSTPVPFSRGRTSGTATPSPSTAPYGLAKKMLLVLSDAYRRQYGSRLLLPGARQPLRARRQLRPRGLPRGRGDGPQVRRGRARAATTGSSSGARASRPASSSTSTTPPGRCCSPPSATTPPSRSTSAPARRSRIRDLAELIVAVDAATRARRSGTRSAPTASRASAST